jgi:hypothetical protein
MFKLLAHILITLCIGVLYVFSAWKKMSPIDLFQFRLAEDGICGGLCSVIGIRILIIWELALGILMILHITLYKFTYRAFIWTSVVFILYLTYLFFYNGAQADCGCFGEHYKMTPGTAILKNILVLGLVVYLKHQRHRMFYRYSTLMALGVFGISAALVFGLRPVSVPGSSADNRIPKHLNLDTLWTSPLAVPKPASQFKKGKSVIAFFSLTCSHCIEAAYKLHILKLQFKDAPFLMVLGGRKAKLQFFLNRTKSADIPFTLFEDDLFYTLCEGQVPRILLCQNLKPIQSIEKYELEPDIINSFFNTP